METVRLAMIQGQRYYLICMDIMMPEMDGREAVRQVRALEKEVIRCLRELCDAYLMKPIELAGLHRQMKSYGLVQ